MNSIAISARFYRLRQEAHKFFQRLSAINVNAVGLKVRKLAAESLDVMTYMRGKYASVEPPVLESYAVICTIAAVKIILFVLIACIIDRH